MLGASVKTMFQLIKKAHFARFFELRYTSRLESEKRSFATTVVKDGSRIVYPKYYADINNSKPKSYYDYEKYENKWGYKQ